MNTVKLHKNGTQWKREANFSHQKVSPSATTKCPKYASDGNNVIIAT